MDNTVKIRKGNKVKNVPEGRLDAFLNQGYEQINEQGEVIQRAKGGATVPIAKYNRVVDELEKLKNGNMEADVDALKSENAAFKEEIERLKRENDALKAENDQFKKENAILKGKITKLEKADK